jgi:hypothetical protein
MQIIENKALGKPFLLELLKKGSPVTPLLFIAIETINDRDFNLLNYSLPLN